MIPTIGNSVAPVPPPAYYRAQERLGPALHIDALTLVTMLHLLTLCRLAVHLAHHRCPPPLPGGPGGAPRTYSEASLLLIALLRTLRRLSYADLQTYLREQKEADQRGEYYPSITISVITYGEVYQGIFYGTERDKAEAAFLDFIECMQVHEITKRIAKRFALVRGELMQNKQTKNLAHPKNSYDLYIAATALEFDMTLITSNSKDYQGIPGLKLYQPSSLKTG